MSAILPGTVGMYDHMNRTNTLGFTFDVVDLAKSVIAHHQELSLLMAITTRLQFPDTGVARTMPTELEREFGHEFNPQLLKSAVFLPFGETGFVCTTSDDIAYRLVELNHGIHRFLSALIQHGSAYAERLTGVMKSVYQ